MKKFGSFSEQVDSKFRTSGDSKEVTLDIPSTLAGDSLTLTLPNVPVDLVPDVSDILVSNDSVSTLTNKTLTAPVIASIVNTGILTLPTDTDTLVGRQTTDTLTNKSINADNNTITNIDNAAIKDAAGIALDKLAATTADRAMITDGSGFLVVSSVTATELAQLSGVSFGGNTAGDVVTTDGTQTLTNKTLTSPILSDVSLTLPKINEAVALTATSTELNQLDGNTVGGISAGDIATIDGLQTLTNKNINAAFNNITNIGNDEIESGANIDATKIGTGVVDTTEFNKLNTVGTDAAGEIVSTDGTQTISNKSIDADTNTITNIEDANVKSGANINANKIGTGTIENSQFNKLDTVAGDIIDTVSSQTMLNKTFESFKYTKTSITAASSIAKGVNPIIELTGTAADLEYITGGAFNEIRIITNETNGSLNIVNDAGGTYGFYTGTGEDIKLPVNASVYTIYDSSVGRWKVIGGAGAGGLTLANVSATLNPAVKNTHYLTDSSGGAFTITLPAGEEGAVFRFSDVTGSWSTNNVTISPDGAETINGDTSLILDIDSTWAQLMWDGTEWKLDDAIVNDSADFTGDVSITGSLEVNGNAIVPNRWGVKTLNSNFNSSGINNIPDLQLYNLEIGKTYRVSCHYHFDFIGASATTETIRIRFVHDGNILTRAQATVDQTTTDRIIIQSTESIVFTATATEFQFVANIVGTDANIRQHNGVYGTGTRVTIEELNNYDLETTAFDAP